MFSLDHIDSLRLLHATICEELSSCRLSPELEPSLEQLLLAAFKLLGLIKTAHAIADTGNIIVYNIT